MCFAKNKNFKNIKTNLVLKINVLDGQRYGHGDIDGFLCVVPYQK